MSVDFMRERVARLLTDACTIAAASDSTFDPDLGYYTSAAGDAVYAGACRIEARAADRIVAAGEEAISTRAFDVFLPWNTDDVAVNHVLTVTSSSDPYLVGRTLRVMDVQGMTDAAYRQVVCEDTLG